ncbi:MAG TPA: sigma 54-interacting transcriptional regulator [Polyangiaceae bacterium]|nr:sigma 54-interacting transcriptional regulator [Polyangiaceae bacterium]
MLRGALPGDRTLIRLGHGSRVIGRASDCDSELAFSEISRRHAEITHEGSVPVLRDLDSTNGVYIDGHRIRCCALRQGSMVRLGAWLGVVEALAATELACWCEEIAPGLIGGVELHRTLAPLRGVAHSDLPIVLVGATGTGKERFAAAIHHFSQRPGPLHAVNCAALPSALAESELFGHERGAFTGAEQRTLGHLRAADGGTLFLDELQDLSLSLQAKVLRAIELRQVTPLGDTRSFGFDARIVVASQWPLEELVASGQFREDLAMRLSGLTIEIPPLRQRRADIPSLYAHFLEEHSSGVVPTVSTQLYERLCVQHWPGNVRQLELLARRMLALRGCTSLSVNELPEQYALPNQIPDAEPIFESRDEGDYHALTLALARTGGNLKSAAQLANISRARAYRLLAKRSTGGEGTPE